MNDREIALALGAGWLINKGWTSAEAAGTRATRFRLQRRYQARLMRVRRRSAQAAALVGVAAGGAGLAWVAVSERRRKAVLRAAGLAVEPTDTETSDTVRVETHDAPTTSARELVNVETVDADGQASNALAF